MSTAETGDFGRFAIGAELGRGGMGRVYEAVDPELGRVVALKVISATHRVSEDQLARFVAEAQITSQLEHPNIVPVHEMGVGPDGSVFFVMRKVAGRSLREVLDALYDGDGEVARHWTRHRLLSAFVQVCQAVAFAHQRGVLHTDLKPDNVMIGDFGEVLLMDWGLAIVIDDAAPDLAEITNKHRKAAGTPGYMSPEQARGDLGALDGRTDVWSLGAILYELVTLERAYAGERRAEILHAALHEEPIDPRVRAPDRRIADELAEIVLRALAREPKDRFPDARALADAVEAFLEGSRRREQAASQLDEGMSLWARYRRQTEELARAMADERRLADTVEPWAPLERKAPLLAARDRIAQLVLDQATTFARVIAAAERALASDPGNPAARGLLADAYWARFLEAEQRGDERDRVWLEARVREYDDGAYAARLEGLGRVSLRTDPPGANVIARPYIRRGLVWGLGAARDLGPTPLRQAPLAMGSWILEIAHPDAGTTRYPVLIERGGHWDAGEAPIPLIEPPQGMVHVPAGRCRFGGDPHSERQLDIGEVEVQGFLIARLPVTMQEYCDFLNALHERDPAEAAARVPRQDAGVNRPGVPYWDIPSASDRYRVPERDKHGDRWDPRWPVFCVDWHDAVAYAAWASERDGVAYRLPHEREWEKAARGVDGRAFPWGDVFDHALCHAERSRPERPRPEPVGSFPGDESVYGVRDLAGSIREWCGDVAYDGLTTLRVVRGGAWNSSPRVCRSAMRNWAEPHLVASYLGFRLACSL